MKRMISFVVDNLELHYYQAELLLHSLDTFSKYKKDNIIVQCLSRVDDIFLNYLKDNGYTYNIIEPYLDGKYCNKLQQLEYFKDMDIDSVILMDTDMFVIDDISALNGNKIMAKIVDAPNPDLNTLERIYSASLLDMPDISNSDWDMQDNKTTSNNFNGGLYFIPKHYIDIISNNWKKWAEWLYSREGLFDDMSKFIHVDQIAFSLAIHENKFEYIAMSANYNFPIHSVMDISSYENSLPISIVHYHREINDFGLISKDKINNKKVKITVDKINNSILNKKEIYFYKLYTKSKINKYNTSTNPSISKFDEKLKILVQENKKINLILHAGTPKTGTTSLQFFMDKKFEELKKYGCLYPKKYINTVSPKHQWLVQLLLNKNFEKLFEYIKDIYEEASASDVDTIFLSTEGIYNHWWDYPPESKLVLKTISKYFNTNIWIFFREPVSFLESFYKQNLKNPQVPIAYVYGQDLSFEKMCYDKWFIKHIDYLSFIYECEYLFGSDKVNIFKHSRDILKELLASLRIPLEVEDAKIENVGLSAISINILKEINKHNLKIEDKKEVVDLLSSIDKFLSPYSIDDIVDEKIKNHVDNLFYIQKKILENDYSLFFNR